MSEILETVARDAAEAGIGLAGVAFPEVIRMEPGAAARVPAYLQEAGYTSIVLVADDVTWKAAGEALGRGLQEAGLNASAVLIRPNAVGDVVADEASVVQLLLEIQRTGAGIAVAAGAGTIHDIVRYAAYTSGIPFLSVPTAPSVDGFTSKGAPLIIRGDKITVPAIGPVAIFADTDILRAAPGPMIAAGFGDMLGKATSLFDWTFGHLTGGEPYVPFVAELTRRALDACIAHAEAIGRRTDEGVTVLTRALIESGLAMLIFGQSHPASGGEHHLSHYWEMAFIRGGRRQLLHGAKVGVACSIIAGLYKRIAEEGPAAAAGGAESDAQRARVEAAWPEIVRHIAAIPSEAVIAGLLRTAGGPATLGELGVGDELAAEALRRAHLVRPNRYTLLRAYNTAGAGRADGQTAT